MDPRDPQNTDNDDIRPHSAQLASIQETPLNPQSATLQGASSSTPPITNPPSTRRRPVSIESLGSTVPRGPLPSEISPPTQSQFPLPSPSAPTGQNPAPSSSIASTSRPPLTSRPSIRAHRQPSIRIRRSIQESAPGANATPLTTPPALRDEEAGVLWGSGPQVGSADVEGRRRSMSDPSRGQLAGSAPLRVTQSTAGLGTGRMASVREEHAGQNGESGYADTATESDVLDFDHSIAGSAPEFGEEYREDLVDVLDTIDPEVSTLTTLTNLQNSMFVPNLGRFVSRRPIYTLTQTPTRASTRTATALPPSATIAEVDSEAEGTRRNLTHTSTITSTLSVSRYAVLPHGRNLEGWTQAEKEELNDHVRHMLHSRRSKFKRGLKGFGQYVSKPLGFFITLYATLITLFGLAWVLFLIGWINVGGKQLYVVNVIDNILVALFAIMGDGLAPFRAWDTYNMIFIAHYHRLSWKLRKKAALPKLENKNDLPELREEEVGLEETKKGDFIVLSDKQQASLTKHQDRFSKSHTFYKPHETGTHFAFPIAYLIAIVVLLDCHSLLQISLGSVTWGIDYKKRPFALTTVILCCSITCNITAGVLISIGDHRTRKKDVLERMDRQELTSEAIEKVERHREERKKEEASDADEPKVLANLPPKVEDTKEPGAPDPGAPSSADSPHNRWPALLKMKKFRSKSSEKSERSSVGERPPSLSSPRHTPLTLEEEEAVETGTGLGGAPPSMTQVGTEAERKERQRSLSREERRKSSGR